jgi:hypothetical protein
MYCAFKTVASSVAFVAHNPLKPSGNYINKADFYNQ